MSEEVHAASAVGFFTHDCSHEYLKESNAFRMINFSLILFLQKAVSMFFNRNRSILNAHLHMYSTLYPKSGPHQAISMFFNRNRSILNDHLHMLYNTLLPKSAPHPILLSNEIEMCESGRKIHAVTIFVAVRHHMIWFVRTVVNSGREHKIHQHTKGHDPWELPSAPMKLICQNMRIIIHFLIPVYSCCDVDK